MDPAVQTREFKSVSMGPYGADVPSGAGFRSGTAKPASGIREGIPVQTSFASDAVAKVNLVLRVLGRRTDGFHEIESFALGAGLRDSLRLDPSPGEEFVVTCEDRSLATPENLLVRAARRLAHRCGVSAGARFELGKRIPIAAGLGGGSSDAATALRLCNAAWELGLTSRELSEVGAEIGSDVPLFFQLPAVRMTGRGETAVPEPLSWSGWVLLVTAPISVSTASVYASWRPGDSGRPIDLNAVGRARDAEVLNGLLRNELEPAVFRVAPMVERVKRHLDGVAPGAFRVSGAGSTLFRLFDTWEAANRVQQVLSDNPFGCGCVLVPAPATSGPVIRGEL